MSLGAVNRTVTRVLLAPDPLQSLTRDWAEALDKSATPGPSLSLSLAWAVPLRTSVPDVDLCHLKVSTRTGPPAWNVLSSEALEQIPCPSLSFMWEVMSPSPEALWALTDFLYQPLGTP